MYDCKVIVKDIFSNDETGKFKALNVSQDKTHSAHSRKSADLDAPDYLEKKAAILWPQMCDEEAWTKLETAVMPKVLQSSLPIAQTMSLLQDEIHTQASTLFGLVTQRKKRIGTFSRRTLLSIKLVQEKNPSFWSNIELSRRRKGKFIFSSGIGKGKVKKLEEEREQTK